MPTHFAGTPRETLALDTFIKLMRAADSVSADLSRSLDAAGLTLGQFGVLEALLHLGTMRQCDLGTKLLRSGSNVTTIVDNLEKRDLVRRTRQTADRRAVDVSLTPAGRRLIAGHFPAHARQVARLFTTLAPDDQRTLGRLCRTLGRSIAEGGTSHD